MISIIIPAKDAAGTLGECLRAVLQQEGFRFGRDYEVILVDDGSTDNTSAIAEQYKVKVIRQSNAGPAAARNTGARIAQGSILVFTDADCAPTPTWLSAISQPFKNPDVVGVKGVYKSSQAELVAKFVQLEYEYKNTRTRKLTRIDFIDTYSAAYRKDIFLLNGGFNEAFPFPALEDQEFSSRLARKGYCMVFELKAVVNHYHDRNLLEYMQRKYLIGYWKAYMLRSIPEKIFTDSHTSSTQRIEIALLAILVLTIPFMLVWPGYSSIFFLSVLAVFFVAISPFLAFIYKRDRVVLSIAPWMLIGRAGALGMGLLKGIIDPPKHASRVFPCQSMAIRTAKRLIDILGGSLGLIISAPIILGATIAIRLDGRGAVLDKQARVGEFGKPFNLFKLRTKVDEEDKILINQMNEAIEPGCKTPNDPRITRTGKHIRRWRLDELPQFWNVLKGEMSLVGPRPVGSQTVANYSDFQRQLLMVKPGFTGPMQVSDRHGLDPVECFQQELYYLTHYTLLEDIKIIFKSFSTVFSGK